MVRAKTPAASKSLSERVMKYSSPADSPIIAPTNMKSSTYGIPRGISFTD
jgi:hypothetical protein